MYNTKGSTKGVAVVVVSGHTMETAVVIPIHYALDHEESLFSLSFSSSTRAQSVSQSATMRQVRHMKAYSFPSPHLLSPLHFSLPSNANWLTLVSSHSGSSIH